MKSDAQKGVVEGIATAQQKLETLMAQTLETQQRLEQLKRQKRESDTELESSEENTQLQAFEAEVVAQMASFKTMHVTIPPEFNEEYGERFNGIWSLHGPLDVSRYPSLVYVRPQNVGLKQVAARERDHIRWELNHTGHILEMNAYGIYSSHLPNSHGTQAIWAERRT